VLDLIFIALVIVFFWRVVLVRALANASNRRH